MNSDNTLKVTVTIPHKIKTSILISSDLCLSSVFCHNLYSTNLLVSSLPEVGFGRTVWRSPPSTVELSRSSLFLCFGSSLSWISAFNQLKLHCVYKKPGNRSYIVECVT
jgi:hypothetical protein